MSLDVVICSAHKPKLSCVLWLPATEQIHYILAARETPARFTDYRNGLITYRVRFFLSKPKSRTHRLCTRVKTSGFGAGMSTASTASRWFQVLLPLPTGTTWLFGTSLSSARTTCRADVAAFAIAPRASIESQPLACVFLHSAPPRVTERSARVLTWYHPLPPTPRRQTASLMTAPGSQAKRIPLYLVVGGTWGAAIAFFRSRSTHPAVRCWAL